MGRVFSSSKDKLVASLMPGTHRQREGEGADRQVLIPFIQWMDGRQESGERDEAGWQTTGGGSQAVNKES